MARLERLTRGATVRGILPDGPVTVVDVTWFGSDCIELTYKDASGRLGSELLYRDREPTLEIVTAGRPWSFDGDGALFRLVSEARRIRLAYLFDPVLAVHTSLVDPLPHQITAVYEAMLPRQPLRFLLADDPGAGKTIMAGLLIKELLVRGDLQRCLICCLGALAEQWQDELWRRFGLPFTIITREAIDSSRSGNPYAEQNLVISRLDHMSRSEDIQAKLALTDWDLVICDEAHKMAASFFAGEVKETKRYKLGRLLGALCRHFLLLTATPHNGKEEGFQLFMALLDADRFEGRFRGGVHQVDTSDLMRRLVKEKLLKFDGTPLFPERVATTVPFKTLVTNEDSAAVEVARRISQGPLMRGSEKVSTTWPRLFSTSRPSRLCRLDERRAPYGHSQKGTIEVPARACVPHKLCRLCCFPGSVTSLVWLHVRPSDRRRQGTVSCGPAVRDSAGNSKHSREKGRRRMTRFIAALAIALAAIMLPLVQFGHIAHASGGNRNLQTVALRRQGCTATTPGPLVGTARFSLDDQGGIPGGIEIDIAVTAGLPRSSYSVVVLVNPCQVLVSGGTLTTDDSGRGDLSVHVPGTVVPPGASLRVQVVAPADADVLTSDPTTAL